MAIVINGSGTITGVSAGGLPDDSVDAGMMAANSIDSDSYVDGSIDNAHLADDAVGVAELSATGTASSSTFLRGDNAWAAAGGNTPYFYAYSSAMQTVSDYTDTKIVCNTEAEDSGGNYDPSTNYRFTVPSGEGGKYFVTAGIKFSGTGNTIRQTFIYIKKNGSVYADGDWSAGSESGSLNPKKKANFISHIIDLAATDYIELWGSCDDDADGTPQMRGFFLGYKIG